jgi:hypothetical protein
MELCNTDEFLSYCKEDVNDFRYQGFDVDRVVRVFEENVAKDPSTTLDKALAMVFSLFFTRGTKMGGNKSGTFTPNGEGKIKYLKDLGITPSGTANRTAITLSRLAIAYAPAACIFLIRHPDIPRIASGHGNIPNYLRWSGAACMCRTNDELTQFMIWAVEHDKVINGHRADANKVAEFARIGFSGTRISISIRSAVASRWERISSAATAAASTSAPPIA